MAGVAHRCVEPGASQHGVYDDGAACGACCVLYCDGEHDHGELDDCEGGFAVPGVEGQRVGVGFGAVSCVLESGGVHGLYGAGAGVELCGLGPDRHGHLHDSGVGFARAHGLGVRGFSYPDQVLLG
ncbi:hypothetical protein [Candidatus Poriferisocius sp.]|uniref:hypothetical protein n=1 Tax=Candidatus Poriferisocius sp. TaxID=3101276 RepID=UPI003B5C1990